VRNRVLVYAEALDVAAEGAVWYARRVGGGRFEALHVAGRNTDTGIHARWFDYTGGDPRLDVRPVGTDPQKAVLGEVARLRAESDDTVVTVVLPEQFRRRSLLAAAQRAQFRLKLRLLVEPRVVVADVPTVASERRPEGRLPARLVVRVIAGELDEATRRAVHYAQGIGGDDVRAGGAGAARREPGRVDARSPPRADRAAGLRRQRRPPGAAPSEPAPAAGEAGARDQARAPLRAARDPQQRPVPVMRATRPGRSTQ
jgi:hypothetical protein